MRKGGKKEDNSSWYGSLNDYLGRFDQGKPCSVLEQKAGDDGHLVWIAKLFGVESNRSTDENGNP